jgi:endoglucanase
MLPTRIHAAACAIGLGVASAAPLAAQDRTVELLRKIADAAGAPGFEEPIRKVMVDAMRPYATAIRFDGLASIIATRGTAGPPIMVGAHMDELGGGVRRVTPRGLLTCKCSSDGWIRRSSIEVDLLVAMLQKLDAPAVQRLRDVTPEP